MALLLTATAQAYTFESVIDPAVFPSWDTVLMEPGPSGVAVLVKNPDTAATVKAAALFVHPSGVVLAYVYLVEGKAVQYVLMDDCYKETPLSPEASQVLERHLKKLSGMVSL